jgi:hypothetical protein
MEVMDVVHCNQQTVVTSSQLELLLTRACVERFNKSYTDKKEKKIFLIYMEILKGSVAKSYLTNGLLIYG